MGPPTDPETSGSARVLQWSVRPWTADFSEAENNVKGSSYEILQNCFNSPLFIEHCFFSPIVHSYLQNVQNQIL
ncbi:unnamed protein product [Staurois parvus]|uniref:Uncharacterized protein n=1 Tax=Staurois parvus TaxID=386267 RepID=A0ABN9CT66_9NEOB|nr:unnamed protein product [Staurois parvus]